MNKKLVLVAALVFGVVGLILAQGSKAQDAATDNSTNSDASMNADNAAAPAAQ